ncbi:MAG: mechanosensitive ion channel family protein [Bryobacteraceae bacterium]|nr:mechanosensitive ion channel family protein [Bryobacteraceae bacterium]
MLPQQSLVLIWPAATFLAGFAALLGVRHVFLRSLQRRGTAPNGLAAIVAESIRFPSWVWVLAGALLLAIRIAPLSEKQVDVTEKVVVAFLIVSFSLAAAALSARMLAVFGNRQRMPMVVAGMTRTLTYVVVLSIGALTLLAYLKLTITPLLTALGVTGLAVALALQDTLANFFAGVHILVEDPIQVGSFIRLSSGEEGTVTDIGWRTTRVLTGQNNTIVIPNTKITSSILTNFSLPDERVVVDVAILTGREADPDQVMALMVDEAKRQHDVLLDPPPLAFFDPGVTPTHLQFKLEVGTARRIGSGYLKSRLRVAILKRFRAEGVPLPAVAAIAASASGRGQS